MLPFAGFKHQLLGQFKAIFFWCGDSVDGRHPAPPKNSWNDLPVNTKQTVVFHGGKVVQDFVHPQ